MSSEWSRSWLTILCCLALCGPSMGCTQRRGPAADADAAAGACARSIEGDVETARRRLEAGRTAQAALYIEGVSACPDAATSLPYQLLALDIYEDLGRLNEAWGALLAALDLERGGREDLERRATEFEERYVFLVSAVDSRRPPSATYAGPMLDQAIRGQLEAMENRSGTTRRDGRHGYWLYPGRYHLDGVLLTLRPGQEIEVVESPSGRRQR